jgi:hypothetical protein
MKVSASFPLMKTPASGVEETNCDDSILFPEEAGE